MHATRLAEMAGWLTACPDSFSGGTRPLDPRRGLRYWTAAKCRLERWQTALRVFETDLQQPDPRHNPWPAIEVVVQEILISDLLTRVWTALLIQHDRQVGHPELQGIGYSVFIGHLELRNRALRLLLQHRRAGQHTFDRLEPLRRRMERWTDLLLSRISDPETVSRFGFDADRVCNFSADRHLETGGRRQAMEEQLQGSLSAALTAELNPSPANPGLNAEIVAGILECVPSSRFDSPALPRGLLHMQVEQMRDDAEQMLQTLIDSER